jgi:hypothetical protein
VSTLRVDAIQNKDGGDLITAKGMARAWVNFNGQGTVAIRASFNVTSITDNGVGSYVVNFTTAMADAFFAVSGTVSRDTSYANLRIGDAFSTTSIVASAFYQNGGNPTAYDPANVSIVVHD